MRKIEISCAKDAELRDNVFNIGGLAIWHGIGRMDRNDQFEAEATAAVSKPEYFALQKLVNRALYDPLIHVLGTPFFGKGYNSYRTVVVLLRDFVDEMQTLSDEKGIAYDY